MTTLFSFDSPLLSTAIESAVPANFIAEMLIAGAEAHPFAMSKLLGGASSNSPEVYWQEWTRRHGVYIPASTQTSSDTTLVLDTTAGLRVGDLLLNEKSGNSPGLELILVTSIGSSPAQIGVTRGFSGTTPVAVAVARPLKLVGPAAVEGADHSDTLSKNFKTRVNYTQTIKEDFTLSNSSLASMYHKGQAPIDVIVAGAYATLIESVSRVMYQGGQNASSLAGDGSTARHADGIIEMCRTGSAAGDGGFFIDGSAADFGTASTAWDNALDYVRQFSANSVKPDSIILPGRSAAQLSRDGALSTAVGDPTQVVRNVTRLNSAFGDFNVMYEGSAVPDSVALMVKDAEVKWHWLGEGDKQRSIKLVEIGPTGDAKKFQLIMEGCVSARGAYSGSGFGVVYGLGA